MKIYSVKGKLETKEYILDFNRKRKRGIALSFIMMVLRHPYSFNYYTNQPNVSK